MTVPEFVYHGSSGAAAAWSTPGAHDMQCVGVAVLGEMWHFPRRRTKHGADRYANHRQRDPEAPQEWARCSRPTRTRQTAFNVLVVSRGMSC